MNAATWKNTPIFIPKFSIGKVIKVYDGDTITVAAEQQGGVYRFSLRLCGIDTPEKRSHNPKEKDRACFIADYLSTLIMDTFVRVLIVKPDKYGGRYIAHVWSQENIHINQHMLNLQFAIPYDGKTKKQEWTDVLLNPTQIDAAIPQLWSDLQQPEIQ
jgi:endonuclease YncB( thermonuclease family)